MSSEPVEPVDGAVVTQRLEVTSVLASCPPSDAGRIFRNSYAQHGFHGPRFATDVETLNRRFLLSTPSTTEIDELLDGGLLTALLEVTLDERIYEVLLTDRNTSRRLHIVHTLAAKLLDQNPYDRENGEHIYLCHQWLEELFDIVPRLCAVVMKHKEVLCHRNDYSRNTNAAEDLRTHLAFMLYRHGSLLNHMAARDSSWSAADDAHVSMLCFQYSQDVFTCIHATLSVGTIYEPQHDRCVAFVDDAIARGTIDVNLVVERYIWFLSQVHVLGANLEAPLMSLDRLCAHSAFFTEVFRPRNNLMYAIIRATKYHLCSGVDGERATPLILQLTIKLINLTLPPASTQVPWVYDDEIANALVHLLSRSLVNTALKSERPGTDNFEECLTLLGRFAFAQHASSNSTYEASFVSTVKRVWHKASHELSLVSPANAPSHSRVTSLWNRFGERCGVDITSPRMAHQEERPTQRLWQREDGCGWNECLCSHGRPHHDLHWCKGCMNVMYCSLKCQTSDWRKGGHRSRCQRVRR